MSVTNRQRARRWVVWETEYADEGSIEVHARTRRGAIVAYSRAFDLAERWLDAEPLTAGLAKLRRRLAR